MLITKTIRLAISLYMVGFIAACTTTGNSSSDDPVVYLEHDEIRFMMQKLAAMVFNLEKLVGESPNLTDAERQYAVVEQLGEIEKVALKLGAGSGKTNHFLIDSGIDKLVNEIAAARTEANGTPPQYSTAQGLINQCRGCHLKR
ncbi:MAG: hypothetical protein WBM41_15435 [Arenicellales bacterium]